MSLNDKFQRLIEMCLNSNREGIDEPSKYFTKTEVEEALKRFGCNTLKPDLSFPKLLDTVVDENFMGETTHNLRKDTIGMIDYLEEVYRQKYKN